MNVANERGTPDNAIHPPIPIFLKFNYRPIHRTVSSTNFQWIETNVETRTNAPRRWEFVACCAGNSIRWKKIFWKRNGLQCVEKISVNVLLSRIKIKKEEEEMEKFRHIFEEEQEFIRNNIYPSPYTI